MNKEANTLKNTWIKSNQEMPFFRSSCDHQLLITILGLAAFGVVMVFSSSYIFSEERFGDGLHYFRRHIIFLFIGLLLMMVLRFVDYRIWKKLSFPLFLLAIIGMAMVFIPGLGNKVGGAVRWVNLGFITFQPVEFAKIALLIYLARIFSKGNIDFSNAKSGFLTFLWPTLLLAGLSLAQPDFGSAVLVVSTSVFLFYLAGVRFRYLFYSFLAMLPLLYVAIMSAPYRKARFLAFLDPWANPHNEGFQIIQSFLAIYRGGLFGAGLGHSKGKLFYLPEAHNDFIFSVVGEELGFIGMFALCLAFLFLFFRAIKISARAEDAFGSLLAAGIAILLGMEVFFNTGVVLGLLPTKGMNLPFISSGGSSILSGFIAMGLLLSISARSGRYS